MRERDIQDQILKWCQRGNVTLARTGNDRGRSRSLPEGWPDITGWMTVDGKAVMVFIETKRPGEKATKAQLEWLERLSAAGGVAGIAYCLEDAIRILRLGK
jgi:hypothetical protein